MKRLTVFFFLGLLILFGVAGYSAAVVSPSSFVSLDSSVSSSSVSFSLSSVDAISFDIAYFSVDGSGWEPIDLVGSSLDDDWLSGSSSGSFVVDRTGVDRSVFVIVFSCSLVGDFWDCHGGDWQLLEGLVPAVNSEPPQVDGAAWSDPATWSGMGMSVPQAGDVVTIPSGERVFLDVSPPSLDGIMVHGVLEFAHTDLAVTTDFIKVMGDGAELLIGTEAEPFTGDAVVTLTGSEQEVLDAEDNNDHCGSKVICSMGGGRMEMVSDYPGPSWTRLADGFTAEVGDTSITLEEDVGWQVGDEIVIVSTDYDPGQAEKRTITSVNGDTISFSEPLRFMHYGKEYCRQGYCIDMRAEVLHLTRNIKIQGDSSSTNSQIGGHLMAMNEHHVQQMQERKNDGAELVDLWERDVNNPSFTPRIDGVELYRMGQQGILARYPWHWHLYGDASGSYVKNTAVHDSFQRCFTIHGTQNALLENNVAFNVVGHCYFLEDGAEWDNALRKNVGALIRNFQRESDQLIESDDEPSVFWWSNPQNDFIGNVAAGAFGFGFWMDPKDNPDGPSQTNSINVVQVRDGEWGTYLRNRAHSTVQAKYERMIDPPSIATGVKSIGQRNGGTGFMIGDDRRNRVAGNSPQDYACGYTRCEFVEPVAYMNQLGFKGMRRGYQRPLNGVFADNTLDIVTAEHSREEGNVIFAYSDNIGNPGMWGEGSVPIRDDDSTNYLTTKSKINSDSLRAGRSVGPQGVMKQYDSKISDVGLSWKYDGGNAKDTVFIDFYDDEIFNRAAMTLNAQTHQNLMRSSVMINSPQVFLTGDHGNNVGAMIRDLDGTIVGTGEFTEIRDVDGPRASILFDETCTPGHDGDQWALCSGRIGKLDINVGSATVKSITDINTGNKMNGGDGKGWLPTRKTFMLEVDQGRHSFSGRTRDQHFEDWILFAFKQDAPLAPQSAAGRPRADRIFRAQNPQELCNADSYVTVYFDSSRSLQYVKIFGAADIFADFHVQDNPSRIDDAFENYRFSLTTHESPDRYTPANDIIIC